MSQIHDEVQTQFGNSPEYYAASLVHGEGDTLAVIAEYAQPTGSERVLDIAAGTGFATFAVAPNVAHVTATDLTYEMLAKARELASERGISNVEFQVAAAESLPFASESFDIVTCRIAPHHFQNVPAFLSESHRVLRPSGLFCMIDTVCPESDRLIRWQNRVEELRDTSHVWAYPPSEWRKMIAKAGFNIERETQSKNAEIQFSWWTQRETKSEKLVKQIRSAFEELSESESAIYDVRREGDELYFAWPMYSVQARKTFR
ncbi:MAG: class I SAM-dependent methyltransferase [Candidatus Poribacteria bacterium]|nr:class I SAM-dependent methyltransferase [Candidatus Poribacteria bacterium]MDE0506918.1 class I SAM-dependent methyltransferase [Candidatus Poribacteria bacterium]